MSLTVLRAGLDTVEVSFGGSFSDSIIKRLDDAKSRAIETDAPCPVDVGVCELMMQPTAFGKWSWRLVAPEFHLVGRRRTARGAAIAQVKLFSFGLASDGPAMLWRYVRGLASELGNLSPLAVSRADVCVDFQGWTPQPSEMVNVVTPVQLRSTHGTERQVQTFSFGKRTMLRVYNKTEELKKSKKDWLVELWRQCDAYTHGEEVWRVEFQAASEVLKELGIRSMEQLIDKQPALLEYGLRWAQLRVPTGDSTKKRWPEDPRWTLLREAVFDGVPLQRVVTPAELMSLDAAKRRLIGLAALAGAYYGTDDYLDALQRLSFAAEVHMMSEGTDFPSLVQEKRNRAVSGEY
jgi:hypothetical protein